jgi:hypothetical protein
MLLTGIKFQYLLVFRQFLYIRPPLRQFGIDFTQLDTQQQQVVRGAEPTVFQ